MESSRHSSRTQTVYLLSLRLFPWAGGLISIDKLITKESLDFFIFGPAGYIEVIAHEMDKELRDHLNRSLGPMVRWSEASLPPSREWTMGLIQIL